MLPYHIASTLHKHHPDLGARKNLFFLYYQNNAFQLLKKHKIDPTGLCLSLFIGHTPILLYDTGKPVSYRQQLLGYGGPGSLVTLLNFQSPDVLLCSVLDKEIINAGGKAPQ